jgi:2-oxoglutarate ferredoxin oxidoreductase subunit alpha
MQERYQEITKNETKYEEINTKDCDVLAVAYGTTSRMVKSVIEMGKKQGIKIGLIRPITLWPFPYEAVYNAANQESVKAVVSVELSLGQMVDDVKIAVNGVKPVKFFGRTGGMVPMPEDIFDALVKAKGGK